jgi:hypothetical protein
MALTQKQQSLAAEFLAQLKAPAGSTWDWQTMTVTAPPAEAPAPAPATTPKK